MEFFTEFPELGRRSQMELRKGIDLAFRNFSREYGDGIEAFFDPLLFFLVSLEKLLLSTPWVIIIGVICGLAWLGSRSWKLVVGSAIAFLLIGYFGILADDTPPVGLAAFAASAIAQSDPIKTGIQGFLYDIRTAILPFLFIFNTELLMIGIESWWHLLITIVTAILAMLLFAAAFQGYFFVKSRWWETLILLLISFTLFRPGYWWEMVYPSSQIVQPIKIVEMVEQLPPNTDLRLHVEGESIEGNLVSKMVVLPMGELAPGKARLEKAGLELRTEKKRVFVDMVAFDSLAQKAGIDFDWEILSLQIPTDRPAKQWMYLPAFLLLALLIFVQRKRRTHSPESH